MKLTIIMKKDDYESLSGSGDGFQMISIHIDKKQSVSVLRSNDMVEENEVALQISVDEVYESTKISQLRRIKC